jgi:protein tyrosine phosphatase
LTPVRTIEGSDYINASFIDGYRYRAAYIATQGPLLDTTEDFWRMLWEHNSTIVVMLTKLKEMGRVSVINVFCNNSVDDLFLGRYKGVSRSFQSGHME